MNKTIKTEIALGIIIIIAMVVGGIFWISRNRIQAPAPKQESNANSCVLEEMACPDGTIVNNDNPDCKLDQCAIYDESNLDKDIWTKYEDKVLGFSIMIPKYSYYFDAKTDGLGKHAIKITKDNGILTVKEVGQSDGIRVTVKKVSSEDDINKFIKEKNGADCKVVRDETVQPDTSFQAGGYNLKIDQEAGSSGGYPCADYVYNLEYFPEKGIMAYFEMGQDVYFRVPKSEANYKETGNLMAADSIMAASFRFLDASVGVNDLSDWQMYRNEKYGFEVEHPKDYRLKENTFGEGDFQVTFEKTKTECFAVRVEPARDNKELGASIFLDNEPIGKSIMGGEQANKFILPNGYCDGPGCTPPIVAVKTTQNNAFYSAIFYGATDISENNNRILSTFKFTN